MDKFTIERFEASFTLNVGDPVMVVTPHRGFGGASEELARTDRKQGKVVRIKGRATSPMIEVVCGNWTLIFNKRGYLYAKTSSMGLPYLERFDPQKEEEIERKVAAVRQILSLRVLNSPARLEMFFDKLLPNPTANAVVYRDPHKGWLVQFFSETELSLPKTFRDYHYQNQSDRPPNISEKEWGERKHCWKRVFRDVSVPAEAGFTFSLLERDDLSRLMARMKV